MLFQLNKKVVEHFFALFSRRCTSALPALKTQSGGSMRVKDCNDRIDLAIMLPKYFTNWFLSSFGGRDVGVASCVFVLAV